MNVPEKIHKKYSQILSDGTALDLQMRLAAKDASLWSADSNVQKNINQRLGWVDSVDQMLTETDSILTIKNELVEKGFRHCVLLGMGGSSLAPELFSLLFPTKDNHLTLRIADNTSPDAIQCLSDSIDYNQTLFIVASKSGTTIESDSLYRFFYDQVEKNNIRDPGQHFIAITDPDTALVQLARDNNFMHCFFNSADIGGRFSVLSFFGLVPAALHGVDIEQLLHCAQKELESCRRKSEISEATRLGLILGLAAEDGLDKLFIELKPYLKPFAAWLEQLVAESTGKASKGILPVTNRLDDSNHQAKYNLQFTLADQMLQEKGSQHGSQSFDIFQLGAEFFKWEWATAIAGAVMNINPFDEPNVGENKKITIELLESNINADELLISSDSIIYDQTIDSKNNVQNSLLQLLKQINPTDYLAILMYSADTPKAESAMHNFNAKFQDSYKVPSTFGIGPRYLHSTGQLHKGGPNNGIFLVVTTEFNQKIDIPGKSYDFGQLNRAQAAGDIRALRSNRRRLLHIHLNSADDQALENFCDTLTAAISSSILE